jgi:hypothetical protein
LSENIHREDSDWKSQVSITFHCCFTEKCCSLLYTEAPFLTTFWEVNDTLEHR